MSDATFRAGELTAAGLPDAGVEAVLCTDAVQFPDEPAAALDPSDDPALRSLRKEGVRSLQ